MGAHLTQLATRVWYVIIKMNRIFSSARNRLMPDANYDFAAVDIIDAESIGTPGKRTFRVRVLRGADSASLWVEKQQLAALGEAIPRLLDQLTTPDQHASADAETITAFPDEPTVEF